MRGAITMEVMRSSRAVAMHAVGTSNTRVATSGSDASQAGLGVTLTVLKACDCRILKMIDIAFEAALAPGRGIILRYIQECGALFSRYPPHFVVAIPCSADKAFICCISLKFIKLQQ